ncbi:hypothetical protein [Chitinimonas koreensis]|uniref:hypothetical protein n=1 Tax=Chitinimonas koreensis TaxID=356302 RepID=UPI000425F6AC|nr:hypothetical protein [Chitinimonas koreensis]QNM95656.1 hypothetical protein H9L41_17610 [Chitinimonas koreensis]
MHTAKTLATAALIACGLSLPAFAGEAPVAQPGAAKPAAHKVAHKVHHKAKAHKQVKPAKA